MKSCEASQKLQWQPTAAHKTWGSFQIHFSRPSWVRCSCCPSLPRMLVGTAGKHCVCVSVNIWRLNWPGVLHEHYPLHLQMFRDFMKISIVACHRARNAHAEQACLRCIDWLLAEREAAAVQWMPQLSQRPCHATSWSAWVCLKLYETMVPPQIWCLMHCWSSCSITFPHISAWKTAFLCHRDENLS